MVRCVTAVAPSWERACSRAPWRLAVDMPVSPSSPLATGLSMTHRKCASWAERWCTTGGRPFTCRKHPVGGSAPDCPRRQDADADRCLGSGSWRRPRGSVGRVVCPAAATGDPSARSWPRRARCSVNAASRARRCRRSPRRPGSQQSSLYYYFRSKEDVLAAIVRKANVFPLELVSGCTPRRRAAAVRLHRFVAGDVAALCALPFDINEVHRYATATGSASPRTGRSGARCSDRWR